MPEIKINTPPLKRPPAINYEKYAELLSRIIDRSAIPSQRDQVLYFEEAQPEKCPHCGTTVRSQFTPVRIAHDIVNCPRLRKATG